MRSDLFDQQHQEVQSDQRFALQSSKMLKVTLGPDVLALKGSMVAYQGQVEFHHESAGGVAKFVKKAMAGEDTPLMRISGHGDVFFANLAANVFLVQLEGDGISVNGTNLLAFDATLDSDVHRTKGAGVMTGGLFNTVVSGTGTVALTADGDPMLLDCSQQPTYVDTQACVAWSANLAPNVVHSMNIKSMLRGGSGEAMQYAFHGPGFVIVQPSEGVTGGTAAASGGSSSSGLSSGIGGLLGNR